jgi:hypothetical protein
VTSSANPDLAAEVAAVYAYYQTLAPAFDAVNGLGGQLIFAGKLSAETAPLLRATNIAGAASLTVSDSSTEIKRTLREGVADFLVTSLDEALRILKNEIRKHQPVAVAIHSAPSEVGNQMMQRGVQPDLLAPAADAIEPLCARVSFLERGAKLVEPTPSTNEEKLRLWLIPPAWNARTTQLDTQLLELLPPAAHAARRWLRLSSRYLGPQARRLRSVACDDATAIQIESLLSNEPGP